MRIRKIIGIFVGEFGLLRARDKGAPTPPNTAEAALALSRARRENFIWFTP